MNIIKHASQQFKKPTGLGGQISTFVMNAVNRKMYAKTIDLLNITNNDVILEMGFGNGKKLKEISKLQPAKLYGIDISEGMVEKAKKLNINALNNGKNGIVFG
jgi:ubiquinone/menaquinone biosynthesis C-methylase UbiE